jgi:para-nitrobenzyl esterase
MIVQTDRGRVEGVTRDGITTFRGIPYAAPPVEHRRWRAPEPAAAWSGVRPAVAFGPACPQPTLASLDGAEPVGDTREDCLYLNVWTAGPAGGKPVMVWLHGGGFRIGDGASSLYDGAPLARDGVVVVTVNYRLGALGFFAHPALEREYPEGPVNFGLLDQIAALAWVQRNIDAFGGDPGNVTIFGQSSGAISVLALYASPLAAGLFHRGIAQSPYALPEHSRGEAVAIGFDIANRGFGLGKHPSLNQLLAVPAAAFERSYTREGRDPMPSLAPVLATGDAAVPRGIRDAFAAGVQHAVPLVIGSTSDEASVLGAFGLDAQALLPQLGAAAGREAVVALKGLYAEDPELHIPADLESPRRFGGLVLRDLLFTMQARWIATQHSKRATARRYYFSYVPELTRADHPHGAPHGGEVVFPFNTGNLALATGGRFTARDREMADVVARYWSSFARTGTPLGPIEWPIHQLNGLLVTDRILKLGEAIAVQSNFRRTRLELFANRYADFEAVLAGN